MEAISRQLLGEQSMVRFGFELGAACKPSGATIFLNGDLGMGKTTLSRGVLQAYGHQGAVKSPTYTLVEPYQLDGAAVYHFDLYRLGDPEELEYIGIRDYFDQVNNLCLVEWPERAGRFLPMADLVVSITPINAGRNVEVAAQTAVGEAILLRLTVNDPHLLSSG